MREIKFRLWCKNKREWERDPWAILPWGNIFDRNHGIILNEDNHVLMQYTGLKDCKRTEEYPEGQEIYEGDIMFRQIRSSKDKVIREYKATVVFNNELAGFYLIHDGKGIMLGTTLEAVHHWAECAEVIGDIYENPELLP